METPYDHLTIPELEAELQARDVPEFNERLKSFLIQMLHEDDHTRATYQALTPPTPPIPHAPPTPPIPHAPPTPPTPKMGERPLIIDLTEYVDTPDAQEVTPAQRLTNVTGSILLSEFLSYFPDELANLIVHEYDIIRTDDYRDNGLYFVFDQDGKRYVIQTPGNYMIAEQALPMLQRYNVKTQDDFDHIYEVHQGELDLYGIRLENDDYSFAQYDYQIGTDGFYDPNNLPAGTTIPIELRAALTAPTPITTTTAPITVPSSEQELTPLVIPAPTPSPMFPKIPTYDVPSFLWKTSKK